jgi:hypothetical protein
VQCPALSLALDADDIVPPIGFPEAECEAISNGVVQIIEKAFTDDG